MISNIQTKTVPPPNVWKTKLLPMHYEINDESKLHGQVYNMANFVPDFGWRRIARMMASLFTVSATPNMVRLYYMFQAMSQIALPTFVL